MKAVDPGWSRLHPLTPLLRAGRALLVGMALVGQQGLRDSPDGLLFGALAVGIPLAALAGWLSWRAQRFRLTATELQIESGIVTKRSRRVPLARLQSVDVVRPAVARLLGLAELRLEVVGGSESEAPLAYLSEQDAQRLRAQLLDLSAGRDAATETAPERVLVSVPSGVLVASTLLGAPALVLAIMLPVVVVLAAIDVRLVGPALFGTAPLLLGVGSVTVRRLLAEYGSTVAESQDGLRLRSGLLDLRTTTVPPGRLQTILISEPLLWRRFGWVRLDVDVAGFSRGGDQQQVTTGALLPVAPRELALRLVERVLETALPVADRPVPRAARWRAPLSAPRLRVGLDDRHLVVTSGVFTRRTHVVPLAKLQSVRSSQGPWQRRLDLASVHGDSAGRRLTGAVAAHRSAHEAAELVQELVVRARAARGAVSAAGS